jgi:hypothetical protein
LAQTGKEFVFAWQASVANAPIKQAMGNGTSIGWIGCLATCAVGCRFSLYVKGGGLFIWGAAPAPSLNRLPRPGFPNVATQLSIWNLDDLQLLRLGGFFVPRRLGASTTHLSQRELFRSLKFFDLGIPMFGDHLGLLLIEPGQL